MDEVEKEFKLKGTVSKKFTIPMLFWEEWERDCVDNFNNTYHLKMQFDHEFRREFASISKLLMQDIVEMRDHMFELSARIDELANTPKEEKKSDTFGGK